MITYIGITFLAIFIVGLKVAEPFRKHDYERGATKR